MVSSEDLFDINKVLQNSFKKIEPLCKEKQIELVFEMHPALPRKLRGDADAFEMLLVVLLSFVFENTQKDEIVLDVSAPEDFVYEDFISLKISQSGIGKEQIETFLETELASNLKVLNGELIKTDNLDLFIQIPLILGELGFRRHYRLPSKSMLQKKVLLLAKSENVTISISKMFKYFPYDVDFYYGELKGVKIDLMAYDLVVVEDSLVTEQFAYKISKLQEVKDLKYVLLWDYKVKFNNSFAKVSTYLKKPVTQESIFELIISLFQGEGSMGIKDKIVFNNNANLQDKNLFQEMIEKNRSEHCFTLDTTLGITNAKKSGSVYAEELSNFLETFDRSDLYFREIVHDKQSNKIKDFCIDLEKKSKSIGAECMQKFANEVSLIFVYDKMDMLPIYPGRYHIELEKLILKIKKYLHIQ